MQQEQGTRSGRGSHGSAAIRVIGIVSCAYTGENVHPIGDDIGFDTAVISGAPTAEVGHYYIVHAGIAPGDGIHRPHDQDVLGASGGRDTIVAIVAADPGGPVAGAGHDPRLIMPTIGRPCGRPGLSLVVAGRFADQVLRGIISYLIPGLGIGAVIPEFIIGGIVVIPPELPATGTGVIIPSGNTAIGMVGYQEIGCDPRHFRVIVIIIVGQQLLLAEGHSLCQGIDAGSDHRAGYMSGVVADRAGIIFLGDPAGQLHMGRPGLGLVPDGYLPLHRSGGTVEVQPGISSSLALFGPDPATRNDIVISGNIKWIALAIHSPQNGNTALSAGYFQRPPFLLGKC